MQIAWLKVELCRLLEEKRSAILRYLKWYWLFGKNSFLNGDMKVWKKIKKDIGEAGMW
jgi:hypothetical protein